jgi:hypothetical protein
MYMDIRRLWCVTGLVETAKGDTRIWNNAKYGYIGISSDVMLAVTHSLSATARRTRAGVLKI